MRKTLLGLSAPTTGQSCTPGICPCVTAKAQAARTDLWTVAPDGGNLAALMADVLHACQGQAPAFWARMQAPAHHAHSLERLAGYRSSAQREREAYHKAVKRGWKREMEIRLMSWLGYEPLDYFAYWAENGGDPLVKAKAKP